MPQPAKGARLGGSAAHEKLLLANLAKSLFEHGRITTTEAKARRLRPVAERLITKAKKGDIHNRRLVLQTITDKSVVHTLFTEIAPAVREPPGWLHPHHQDRQPSWRQRPDGRHRAGRGPDRGSRPPSVRPRPPPSAPSRTTPARTRPPSTRPGRGRRGRRRRRRAGRGVQGRLSVLQVCGRARIPSGGAGPFRVAACSAEDAAGVSDDGGSPVSYGSGWTWPTTARTSPAGRKQRGRRTVQGELEDALRDGAAAAGAGRADGRRAHRRGRARARAGRARRPARGRSGPSTSGQAAAPAGRAAAAGRAGLAGRRGAGGLQRALLGDLAAVRLPGRRPPRRGRPAAARPRAVARPAGGRGRDERGRRAAARASTTSPRTARSARARRPSAPCWSCAGSGRARRASLAATVRADAFCHNMVRALVGAMLLVGDGHRPVDFPGEVLAGRVRHSGGATWCGRTA